MCGAEYKGNTLKRNHDNDCVSAVLGLVFFQATTDLKIEISL